MIKLLINSNHTYCRWIWRHSIRTQINCEPNALAFQNGISPKLLRYSCNMWHYTMPNSEPHTRHNVFIFMKLIKMHYTKSNRKVSNAEVVTVSHFFGAFVVHIKLHSGGRRIRMKKTWKHSMCHT